MTVARVREAEEGHLRPDPGLKLLPLTDIEIFKGLSGYVTEDELRSIFQGFGEITYVKIPRDGHQPNAGTPYRPAPPPPVYPSMGMPPKNQYGIFAPMQVGVLCITQR
ncbi:hypothetical protein MMC14_004798 [Varicellaria rhodocarpa]|nr:hypothetical protein [Varicellaria rhodocarpa]